MAATGRSKLIRVSIVLLLIVSLAAELVWSRSICSASSCLSSDTYRSLIARPHKVSIVDFGGVGDGATLNTAAFEAAMAHIRSRGDAAGGSMLYIPPGRWLTGCLNLTSHLTLFLEQDAVLLASQDPSHWPVVDPLPSYGRGRELPGRRYGSFLHGSGLSDVAIMGNNGTIDGQGSVWWTWFRSKTLKYTRGHLVELMYSSDVVVHNVTLANSPFWTLHPVYCTNVVVKGVSILAPRTSPNTDGIDPDSSSNVCIEDCYIRNGDDAVAVKSGWDEYGIEFSRPSHDILIRNVKVEGSHGISLGSEMSGGIYNVVVHNVTIAGAPQAIHVKTSAGRGAYITNASFTNFNVFNVGVAVSFTGLYGDHPDTKYDPKAYAKVGRISVSNLIATATNRAGDFRTIEQMPFTGICISDLTLVGTSHKSKAMWNCSYLEGYSSGVEPQPCPQLNVLHDTSRCKFVLPKPPCL